MSTVLELSSIKTPDFFHTFTVNFALAPVVLHPLQYGVMNLERVSHGYQAEHKTYLKNVTEVSEDVTLTKMTRDYKQLTLIISSQLARDSVKPKMPKIVYRPKFCSFDTKIAQLDRIMEKKESSRKKCAFL